MAVLVITPVDSFARALMLFLKTDLTPKRVDLKLLFQRRDLYRRFLDLHILQAIGINLVDS